MQYSDSMKRGNQTKLAKQVGYKNPAAISLIYNGHRRPHPVFAKRLALLTNTDMSLWLDLDTPLQIIQKAFIEWERKNKDSQ